MFGWILRYSEQEDNLAELTCKPEVILRELYASGALPQFSHGGKVVPGVVENLVDVAILELAYGVFTATYLEVKHFINRLPRYFGKTYITSVWSLFKRSPDQVLSLINTKFLSCSRVQIMFLVYNNYYALLC